MNTLPFIMTPFRPSLTYMLYHTSPWLITYCLSITTAFIFHPLMIILSLVFLGTWFCQVFQLAARLYIVCPDMIMVSNGLLFKTVQWFEVVKIQKITIEQNSLMKRLNICNIRIESKEELQLAFLLKGVDVGQFSQALEDCVQILEKRLAYSNSVMEIMDLVKKLATNYAS